MIDLLIQLYGKTKAQEVLSKIESLIISYKDEFSSSGPITGGRGVELVAGGRGVELVAGGRGVELVAGGRGVELVAGGRYEFTQKDVVLITYPDQFTDKHHSPLAVLLNFLNSHVRDTINTIHILPFFPYSSDDGFSIIDYFKVDEALGGWEGIKAISNEYKIMCDLVLNHISSKSRWFKEFVACKPEYSDYFIVCNPGTDLTKVTRPRPYPLLTPFHTKEGEKWLWTTFSEDQIDLNFKNPDLLIEMVKVLFTYISHGITMVRLDAVAYIWKELGTNCIHRPEVHTIVKLLRKILDMVSEHVVLITETNVPHKENISYFGSGADEAQMVYQFSLPPLIVHALIYETAAYISKWASTLQLPGTVSRPAETIPKAAETIPKTAETFPKTAATFFNFTASHDGIGVRPLQGLVPDKDIDKLVRITRQRGGDVSYKTDKDGNKSPYELNINYFSMLTVPGEDISLSIKRFLLSQSIMLTMPGVPGIYIHSLIGSINDKDGVKKTKVLRSINREKLVLHNLEKELTVIRRRKEVFSFYMKMLYARINEPAFHPHIPCKVLHTDEKVFALQRIQEKGASLIVLHNMSSEKVAVTIHPLSVHQKRCRCLLTSHTIEADNNGLFAITLPPHHFLWLREELGS